MWEQRFASHSLDMVKAGYQPVIDVRTLKLVSGFLGMGHNPILAWDPSESHKLGPCHHPPPRILTHSRMPSLPPSTTLV